MMRVILVTGGCGFIGSNFINYFIKRNKNYIVVNMDKLTYAGNTKNLTNLKNNPRYHFIKGDICNHELVNYVMKRYRPNHILNFAAESHVDRSINRPSLFAQTNIMGTLTLLESARNYWRTGRYSRKNRFLQVSTDEVYGSTKNSKDFFMEESNLLPNSPYSASKASADLMVRAYGKTFGIPVITTRCCNNYGPYQNAEKFIPKCITNALKNESIPLYGDGLNIREWIYVQDHCTALIRALFYGKPGEIYNIGSGEEAANIYIVKKILKLLKKPESLIKMVKDRPAHDRRYALNSYKAISNFKWSPRQTLDEGLKSTVNWYMQNEDWWTEKGP